MNPASVHDLPSQGSRNLGPIVTLRASKSKLELGKSLSLFKIHIPRDKTEEARGLMQG